MCGETTVTFIYFCGILIDMELLEDATVSENQIIFLEVKGIESSFRFIISCNFRKEFEQGYRNLLYIAR